MKSNNLLDIAAIKTELALCGLNLFESFAVADVADSMPEFKIPATFSHLFLVGSAGVDLWNAITTEYFSRSHPVDEYSFECVENCLANHLAQHSWSVLFPSPPANTSILSAAAVPLQKLGGLAGWHHPSPLGIGINATQGLWFAYRAVVIIDAGEAVECGATTKSPDERTAESPCLTCDGAPCLSHCPADALSLTRGPDLNACVEHRLAEESSCASTCLARLACPVGEGFRYCEKQTAYFYDRSRVSVQRWIDEN